MELEEYGRIADAERTHWWYRSMPALMHAVLGPRLRPGLRILDAGCGPGANFEWMRPYGEISAVDLSPLAIELANERHPEVESAVADITALPFADESFDLAVEITVLTMVRDDALAVSELARVTRPGGTVLLMEPAYPSLYREHDAVQGAVRRYRLSALAARADDAGLAVERTTHCNSFLVPPAALLSLLHRIRRPAPSEATSDFDRDRAGAAFYALASAERRLIARRDLPVGLSAIVVARKPHGGDAQPAVQARAAQQRAKTL